MRSTKIPAVVDRDFLDAERKCVQAISMTAKEKKDGNRK